MISYYGSVISPNKTETVEGFLICRNVPIARTGDQIYLAKELQIEDKDAEETVTVHRYEEDVFEPAVLASFEGKPVTNDHPTENVSPENFGAYVKGHVQNVRRDGDFIVADLHIQDADLIDDIQSGRKTEVSCGYVCNYDEDGKDYKQTHIRGNHVAVVERGRAGHEVAIKDAAAETAGKGQDRMKKKKSKFLKDVFMAFGKAAKDAEPEELEELAETAAETLKLEEAQEVDPAEKAPETAPAKTEDEDEKVEEKVEEEVVETKDDERLDRILELLLKMVGEDKETEILDEEDIDEEIKRREEESETIEADEMEETTEDECKAADAAAIMRTMRPAIAKITDKKQKAAVCDALFRAFGVKSNTMDGIMAAAKKNAKRKAADSAKPKYEKICSDQQNAYAARNPHKKEEV